MRTFRFSVLESTARSFPIAYIKPAGTVTARVVATSAAEVEETFTDWVTVNTDSLVLNVPAFYTSASNLPATFVIETKVDAGPWVPEVEARCSRIVPSLDSEDEIGAEVQQLFDSGLINNRINSRVAEAVEAHTPGIELGYAERTSNFTTTAVVATTVTTLSVTVEGNGRECEIEFYGNRVYHSGSAGTQIELTLYQTSAGTTPIASDVVSTFSTSTGRNVILRKRMVLAEGTSYTFTVQTNTATAGTTTLYATGGRPMYISVKSRR